MGDHLGWFGTDDTVVRVGVRCLDDTCTIAFQRSFRSSELSVEDVELELLGRDMRASPGRGQVVLGDADVTVEFGADALTADVEFTDIVNVETGDAWGDMVWRGMAVENGGFYGPGEEEVGGIFERGGFAGAFGGRRAAD